MKKPLEVLRLYPEHDYTLNGVLASRASRDPARPFMFFRERSWSWGGFSQQVDATARVLAARGIRKGGRMAVMARNCDGHVLLLLALSRLGAIMVPVNPEFGIEEAKYVLHHAEVSAIATTQDTLAVARDAAAGLKTPAWFVMLDSAAGDVPLINDLANELAKTATQTALPSDITGDSTCLIVYTSGTTGFPKGAMHSQKSFVTGGEAFVQRVYLQDDDRVMVVLPLFHINAMFYSVAGTLAAGASMVIIPKFSASTFWQTAVDTGATQVNIIEAIGSILRARPRSEFRTEHRIAKVYGVRASMDEAFKNDFKIAHRIGGYGMTEIPGVTCNPFEGIQKLGSMGPIGRHPDPARPWAQCRVVDDEGRDVPVGEAGELWVKTPIIMQGYFRDPEQTAGTFEGDWFKTGDLVKCDEDGYYYFISRKRDIIRRRGENIAAAELDRVVGEHPAVAEAGTIAVPSELGEDDIFVIVATKPGAKVSAEEIAEWCRARLAPQKVPRYVAFVDELPHTPTHKIAKAVLRADTALRARSVDLQPVTAGGRGKS
ncbi:MAG: class I adenylate-forming enzyme family protein [Betaproteobacteria bacterium]